MIKIQGMDYKPSDLILIPKGAGSFDLVHVPSMKVIDTVVELIFGVKVKQ